MNSVLYNIPLPLFAAILFALILLVHLTGVQAGNYQRRKNPAIVTSGLGPLETALLGLLSLLLSFTFSMSASRYDARRNAIVTEANEISTAVLNADLYPDSIRKGLRSNLQLYVNERVQYYQYTDEKNIEASLAKAKAIHTILWNTVASFSHDPSYAVITNQMVPALHHIESAATSRDAISAARVPYSIIWLLVTLALLGSFVIGFAKPQRTNDWMILLIYATMTVATLCTIIDLDSSKKGFIKTEGTHTKIDALK